jgi:hypothetical protein
VFAFHSLNEVSSFNLFGIFVNISNKKSPPAQSRRDVSRHIMQKITAKYSEVRNAILEVKNLTENCCGIKSSKISLNKSYYQDFGIYELDWDFFLDEYEKKFNSNLDGLKYERFFPEIGDKILYLKATPKIIFYKLLSIFDKKYKLELQKLNSKFKKDLEKLTVGDIVLSVLAKKFVERKNIQLVLTK